MKMVVLGNEEFALGMRFSGIGKSYVIRDRHTGIEVLRQLDRESFIIANVSVLNLIPELKEFNNVVSVPDDPNQLKNIDDLKGIIKAAVGIELEVV